MNVNELAEFIEKKAKVSESNFDYIVLLQCAAIVRDAQNAREGALREVLALPKYIVMHGFVPEHSDCVLISDVSVLLTKPAQAETVKSLRCPACGESFDRWMDAEPAKPVDDISRCAICCWPLAESQEKGCMRGNCSMRPFPRRFYNADRAKKEYGNLFVPEVEPTKPVGETPPKYLDVEDIRHLITRLEAVADLLRRDEKHMAMAKILADISALKGVIGGIE